MGDVYTMTDGATLEIVGRRGGKTEAVRRREKALAQALQDACSRVLDRRGLAGLGWKLAASSVGLTAPVDTTPARV